MQQQKIQVTVLFEKQFWVGIFERKDGSGYRVARKVFGTEPADSELYEFILKNYHELKFTEPQQFTLIVKRKNPKRVMREVKKEVTKAKRDLPRKSHAQEVLQLELEKNKKIKKTISKAEKEAKQKKLFAQKQAKKKKKVRGH